MSNHAKEPWFIGTSSITNLNICYADSDCHEVIVASPNFNFSNHHAIARRIVACVNACDGIETARLEIQSLTDGKILGLVRSLKREAGKIAKQRDELLDALEEVTKYAEMAMEHANKAGSEWEIGYALYEAKMATAKAKGGAADHFPDAAKMVPDGWQLVPKVPTRDMITSGNNAMSYDCCYGDASDAYLAMLAGAPKYEGGAA